MANIATYLARIKNAILGEEVRDSIHDSIAAINQDVGTANTNASNAVSTANSASTAASQAVSTANAASAASSQAVETANAAKEESSTASENAQTALDNSQAAKDAAAAANTAAGKANEATTAANAAATTANAAAANANAKATAAESKANEATTAATQATEAADDIKRAAANGDYSATIESVSVVTGEPGTNASVTNTGTKQKAELKFTIPRGETGETGPQGAIGPRGPQGDKGDPGEIENLSEQEITFISADELNPSAWSEMPGILTAKEKLNSILNKISIVTKNVRFLGKILGNTDIAKIGDATVTGALAALMRDKLNVSDVVNDLFSTDENKALSAAMGKQLQEDVDKLNTSISQLICIDNESFIQPTNQYITTTEKSFPIIRHSNILAQTQLIELAFGSGDDRYQKFLYLNGSENLYGRRFKMSFYIGTYKIDAQFSLNFDTLYLTSNASTNVQQCYFRDARILMFSPLE